MDSNSKLALQLRPVAIDEIASSFVECLQSTSAPDTARGDCRESRKDLWERDAAYPNVIVSLLGQNRFQLR